MFGFKCIKFNLYEIIHYYLYKSVLRYFKPESTISVTTFFPGFRFLAIFIAAATPIPDDFLMAGLSLIRYPFWKVILPGWIGKNVTTIFYCILPILILLGFTAVGTEMNDISSIVSEAIMLLVTLTLMFLILGFDWNKYLENRKKKRQIEL